MKIAALLRKSKRLPGEESTLEKAMILFACCGERRDAVGGHMRKLQLS